MTLKPNFSGVEETPVSFRALTSKVDESNTRGRAAHHTCLGIEVDTLRQRWTDTVLVHVAFHAGLHGHGNKVRVDEFLARILQARGWCTRDGKRDPCSGLPILVFLL